MSLRGADLKGRRHAIRNSFEKADSHDLLRRSRNDTKIWHPYKNAETLQAVGRWLSPAASTINNRSTNFTVLRLTVSHIGICLFSSLKLIVRKLKITIHTFAHRFENNVDCFYVIIFIIKCNRFIVGFSARDSKE